MKKSMFLALTAVVLTLAVLLGACTEIDMPTVSEDDSATVSDSKVPDSKVPDSSDAASSEDSSAELSAESSEESQEPKETRISFLACPDNIIHPSVYYHALQTAAANKGVSPDYSNLQTAEYEFSHIYENIKDLVKEADLSYINVETLIGGNENPINGYPMFNSPEAAGETLVDMGFDIFNLAHNHMLDSGNDKYLINCDRFFTQRGGVTLGYYENQADVENIVVVEKKGVKIAFLAYTYATNGIKLGSSAQTYIPYINSQLMKTQMAKAKQIADLVFVSMHWGDEDTFVQNASQRQAAQLLVDEGADVIIGMHPHVIQETKWVERADGTRCLLTYSLGNLLSGMYGGKNALGSLLSFDIVAKQGLKPTIENVRITPTVCHYVKKYSVNTKMDTGFRDFKIYLLEDYTAELAAAHGCHMNKGKISSFDNELDGNFSLETLYAKVKRLTPAEFLSDKINNY